MRRGSGRRARPTAAAAAPARARPTPPTLTHLARVGAGVLALPAVMAALGWGAGSVALVASWFLSLQTFIFLVRLHEQGEHPNVRRMDRYPQLTREAFGERLGFWALTPFQLILFTGIPIAYAITGAESLQKCVTLLAPGSPWGGGAGGGLTRWVVVFSVIQLFIVQVPSFHSLSAVSLVGALASLFYILVAFVGALVKGKAPGVRYGQPAAWNSASDRVFGVFNALATAAFAYGGHNIACEIQATLPLPPSTIKRMVRGGGGEGARAAAPSPAPAHMPAPAHVVPPADVGPPHVSADRVVLLLGGDQRFLGVRLRRCTQHPGLPGQADGRHCRGQHRRLLSCHGCECGGVGGGFRHSRGADRRAGTPRPHTPPPSSTAGYHVYLFPLIDMADGVALKRGILPSSPLWRLGLRTTFVVLIGIVASAVPFFGVVLGFLGAVSITPTTFMMPCALWLKLRKPTPRQWQWWFCWFTLAVMGVVMVVGATGAVRDFIVTVVEGAGSERAPFRW